MIVLKEDNKIYKLYIRTNRRVKWQYSEYCGRYETVDIAVSKVAERMGDTPCEYYIENMLTDESISGFSNWGIKNKRK